LTGKTCGTGRCELIIAQGKRAFKGKRDELGASAAPREHPWGDDGKDRVEKIARTEAASGELKFGPGRRMLGSQQKIEIGAGSEAKLTITLQKSN
jgi:hypothetical protein